MVVEIRVRRFGDIQLLYLRPRNSNCCEGTRAKLSFPTEEGRRVLGEIERRVLTRQQETFSALTRQERDLFLELCRKLILGGGLAAPDALGAEGDR